MHLAKPIDVTHEGIAYRYHGAGDWEWKPCGDGEFMELAYGLKIPALVEMFVTEKLRGDRQ